MEIIRGGYAHFLAKGEVRAHPDLVGGMGIYARTNSYIHIDARGIKVRWRG